MERCDNPWAREHLVPIFRRISVLPLLFGSDSTELSRSMVLGFVIPSKFDSLEDAQVMTDDIFNRLKRLCSMKKQGLHFDRDMEREYIKSLLERWQFLMKGLDVHAAAQADARRRIQTEHDMILDDLDYPQDVAPCSKEIPWGSRKEECFINERQNPASAQPFLS
ncbi:hypothetical protein RAB80_014066 [Fusarium oxysporum f. sp. vasinfectum]|nr:hypothetical protein RAB80_014066 [Fusarium oxysporum f. sp. vasinfectum]KAK2923176.1 hypothetical protein FoTM2_016698 [Fusarium oxysporum f. sp. vasinfectum]